MEETTITTTLHYYEPFMVEGKRKPRYRHIREEVEVPVRKFDRESVLVAEFKTWRAEWLPLFHVDGKFYCDEVADYRFNQFGFNCGWRHQLEPCGTGYDKESYAEVDGDPEGHTREAVLAEATEALGKFICVDGELYEACTYEPGMDRDGDLVRWCRDDCWGLGQLDLPDAPKSDSVRVIHPEVFKADYRIEALEYSYRRASYKLERAIKEVSECSEAFNEVLKAIAAHRSAMEDKRAH